jgi:PAS domain S-box-containing protein
MFSMPGPRDPHLSQRKPAFRGYLLALVASAAAVTLRGAFDFALGNSHPFVFSFAAIAVSAAYGGWRPALGAIVLSYAAVNWYFMAPRFAFSLLDGRSIVALASYGLTAGIITAMAEWMRRAERRARENGLRLGSERERWRVTLQSIGDAVVVTDADGLVTFLNPVAEKLSGWTNAESHGRPVTEVLLLFHEETGVPSPNPVQQVLREHIVVAMANHTVLRQRGGGEIPIEDSAAPIFASDGSLDGAIIVFHDVTARRSRERAVRDAEWRARTALEMAGAGAWVWEVKSDRVFGDEQFAWIFGLPLERCRAGEPIATFFAAIHPDDLLRVEAAIKSCLEEGEPYRAEYRVRTLDGSERWVDARGRIERDEEGAALRLPGVLIDITERRIAERLLRASELRSRAIVDTAIDGVILMDARGMIVDWNPAAEQTFGRPRNEVIGLELALQIVPERFRDAHRKGLAHFLATREGPVLGRRLELSAIRGDGTEFPVELSINPLPLADEAMFVGFIRDISQRKTSEAELAERARLAALRADIASHLASAAEQTESLRGCCELLVRHLDASFARVWVLEESDNVLVLRASAGLYTHVDGPHSRVPVGHFKIGRIAQSRRAHLTNDVAHDPNISSPEWAAREGMVAFAGYPLVVDGRLVGVVALFSQHALSEAVLGDLAPIADSIAVSIERRTADAALRAEKERAEVASRAKDNFLATLSHELRTPLMPVLMTANALRDDERLPDDVRSSLGMIGRNIALEARLIDDLLDLTRIAKGKLSLREEACDAHSLLSLVVGIVRDEAREKPITLELDLAARKTGLRADPARLQQVFWNLLRNAIKFTPAGGRITICSRDETDGRLRVEVRDTGIGLPPNSLETIFRPFEQAGRENDHQFGGLGLGLAIARAIVDLHGGELSAHSDGIGKGATFVIELPGAREQPAGVDSGAAGEQPSTEAPPLAQAALRLLVVEDHEPTLTVLRRLLTRAGHHVVTADSIANALSAAAKSMPFDLLISDLGLPDGTGLELMSKLHHLQPDLRGIALSGYGMDEDLRRSYESGFHTHLVKPVDFQQLTRALREVTGTYFHT